MIGEKSCLLGIAPFAFRTTRTATVTLVNSNVTHGVWIQQPPQTVAAGATSGNFQMSYNFQPPADLQLDMHYSIPGQTVNFTAAAIIDQPHGGTVTCTPSGAGPGQHHADIQRGWRCPSLHTAFYFQLNAAERRPFHENFVAAAYLERVAAVASSRLPAAAAFLRSFRFWHGRHSLKPRASLRSR